MKNELKSSPIGLLPNDWRIGMLGEYLDYIQPTKYITKSFNEIGNTPVLTANKAFILGYTDETEGVYNNVPVIIFDDFTTDSKFIDFPFKVRSSALKILAFTTKEIDINYLYESLKRIKYQSTEHKRYWISEYQYLKIPIPPVPEQQKIAEILSTVDAKIEIIDQQISETQDLKKGLMQQLLTKGIGHTEFKDSALGKIPKSWEVVKLKDVAEYVKDGTHGTHKEVEAGIPLLSAKDIRNGKIHIPDNCRKLSNDDFNSIHRNFKLMDGDVLLTVVGSIGRIAIIEGYKNNYTFQRSVGYVRFNNENYPYFFKQFFQSEFFTKQLSLRSNASAQAGVYLGELSKIPIPVISYNEQKEIAEILTSFDDKLQVLSEKKTTYQELKQGLMQQLLTGKVRV